MSRTRSFLTAWVGLFYVLWSAKQELFNFVFAYLFETFILLLTKNNTAGGEEGCKNDEDQYRWIHVGKS